jgi:hypothetical protein
LRTVQRWLAENPEFNDELRKAEMQAIDQASRRLIGSQELAISQLLTVLDSPTAKDADRLKAARILFEFSTRLKEVRDFEERLSKLEVQYDVKKP